MAASAGPVLEELHARYGDQVAFVTLYVREAHPGERVPQPRTFAEKLANARAYQQRDRIPWPVAVDDLDGAVHHAIGRMPDMAYVIDRRGRVAARVLWSNDARGLRRMVRAIADDRTPTRRTRFATLVPFLRGVGVASEVLDVAGRSAGRDMLVTFPPFYLLARVARMFRPLSPLGRGVAALGIVAGSMLVLRVAMTRTRW